MNILKYISHTKLSSNNITGSNRRGKSGVLHEYNAVCGKTGVKHHCRTTLNLKSR